MATKVTKKKILVLFWIKSSRGTNEQQAFYLPGYYTKKDIEIELETWCSYFGAWHVSGNFVNYGWKFLKQEAKSLLNKRYKTLTQQKDKINEKWNTLKAQLTATDKTKND